MAPVHLDALHEPSHVPGESKPYAPHTGFLRHRCVVSEGGRGWRCAGTAQHGAGPTSRATRRLSRAVRSPDRAVAATMPALHHRHHGGDRLHRAAQSLSTDSGHLTMDSSAPDPRRCKTRRHGDVGKPFVDLPMNLARPCRWLPGQQCGPRLQAGDRASSARRRSGMERSLDIDGACDMALDQVAVVAVHAADEITDGGGRARRPAKLVAFSPNKKAGSRSVLQAGCFSGAHGRPPP